MNTWYKGFQVVSRCHLLHTRTKFTSSYDYVIVGSGSAGCVLANRLSENEELSVVAMEAGPRDAWWDWRIHMPVALGYNLATDVYNWYYNTTPQKYLNNRTIPWPRGRVWGGSSALNAMVYIRGHAKDYDRWEADEGAEGWSYEKCLPYFKKSQTHVLGHDAYRGDQGPLHVSRGAMESPLYRAFIESSMQAGLPYNDDFNGENQEGVGPFDLTIHNGNRWSTSQAYLRPALKRKNLSTVTGVVCTRVLFEDSKAIGVEYLAGKEVKTVEARKEVILAGGAVNTPQLLMLSGIGDENELKKHGINVRSNLSGVGKNLQDHLAICLFNIHVSTMRETSHGTVTLKSNDPREHPLIDPNYLATEQDRVDMRNGLKVARDILSQQAFAPYRGDEILPGSLVESDEDLDAFIREYSDTNYHASCTCKMGHPNDPLSVVDSRTRVKGFDNFRIVDASIMPSIVSGNLNGPVIMMAEKAADIIKEDNNEL